MSFKELTKFPDVFFSTNEVENALRRDDIKEIGFYILGPEGTNIEMASKKWANHLKIDSKSKFYYYETPEICANKAKLINHPNIFPIFVTCAVYYKLDTLFFLNPDCYTFIHHYYMKLDQMQLAAKRNTDKIPAEWVIASHPSPKSLILHLSNKIYETTSNSKAAQLCAEGMVDACITTETARKLYNLKTLHIFGSAVMIFLFGTTEHGINIMNRIVKQ